MGDTTVGIIFLIILGFWFIFNIYQTHLLNNIIEELKEIKFINLTRRDQ